MNDTNKYFPGGGLSNPAKQFGGIFARTRFFNDFPYALPTFVTGTVSATAAIVSAFFIKEVSLWYHQREYQLIIYTDTKAED